MWGSLVPFIWFPFCSILWQEGDHLYRVNIIVLLTQFHDDWRSLVSRTLRTSLVKSLVAGSTVGRQPCGAFLDPKWPNATATWWIPPTHLDRFQKRAFLESCCSRKSRSRLSRSKCSWCVQRRSSQWVHSSCWCFNLARSRGTCTSSHFTGARLAKLSLCTSLHFNLFAFHGACLATSPGKSKNIFHRFHRGTLRPSFWPWTIVHLNKVQQNFGAQSIRHSHVCTKKYLPCLYKWHAANVQMT